MERHFNNQQKFLKITFDDGQAKTNAYLKMPSPTFAVLEREISMCLFEQRKVPKCELVKYWIDEDGDIIVVVNQCDYEIFMLKRSERPHLYVAPLGQKLKISEGSSDSAYAPPEDDPAAFVIHERIECDACGLAPIVGFRYKCIQCHNYDLCQRCEAQHKHPDHMMVRMPKENCPNVIDAWVGPCGRGSGRRSKRDRKAASAGGCPFFECNPTMTSTANASGTEGDADAGTGKHHHYHERKHHRRQLRNGIFSNLYEMMQDFAEGGATYRRMDENVTNTPEDSASAHPKESMNTNNSNANANEATNTVCEEATKTAEAAVKIAEKAAELTTTVAEQILSQSAKYDTYKLNGENATSTNDEEGAAVPKEKPATKVADSGISTPSETESNKNSSNKPNKEISIPVDIIGDLAPLIDLNYAKAGLQLINNFTGLFAKVLESMDGAGDDEKNDVPNTGFGYQTRKDSTFSQTSSMSATTTQNPTVDSSVNVNVEQSLEREDKQNEKPKNSEETAASTDNIATTTLTPPLIERAAETSEHSRSQSEENDWQLIDRQPAESTTNLIDISPSTSTNSIEKIDIASVTPSTPIPTPPVEPKTSNTDASINFEQLSKDLKNHVEKEKQRDIKERKFKIADVLNAQPTPNYVPSVTTNSSAQNGATPKVPNTTLVVYHEDGRINNAIYAMMAMGFSNEGGWLTQLLESVNGNISSALDLMSPAQNQSNI